MSDAGSAETAAQLRIAWAGRGPIAHVHGLSRQTPVQTWAKKTGLLGPSKVCMVSNIATGCGMVFGPWPSPVYKNA